MSLQTENTLVIIKPDFLEDRVPIIQLLLCNGFRITHRKVISFSPDQAAEFYKNHEKNDPYFALKVMSISKGSAEAVVINKVNGIKELLRLIRFPNCYHLLNGGVECKIHASTSKENAKHDIRLIFPNVYPNPSREIHFGTCCGQTNLIQLFADATFNAFEQKTGDTDFISNWFLAHSYKSQLDKWCDQ